MRKLFLLFLALAPVALQAQTHITDSVPQQAHSMRLRFGYLSYDSAFTAMPEYAEAQKDISELKSKYDAEIRRVEEDFNEKYEEFLEGQKDFPQTILNKRQSELQQILDRNIAFREETRRLLASAEKEIYAPLHRRLESVLRTIGQERGYAFIINTDNNACPFIDPRRGDDISLVVRAMLR